jgi:wobble nucleotide-excising tRNase
MINKLIAIRNVGKLRNHNSKGDMELRRLSLVHAENGRGKTTLCGIFRSLQTGQAHYIAERKTLGSAGAAEVNLLVDGTKVSFRNDVWSLPYPSIAIYDSTFVAENVYAGDYVEHDHKKNLYRVIVGAEGLKLVEACTTLDTKSRDLSKQVTSQESLVKKHVPDGTRFEDFLAFQKDEQIETKIAAKTAQVNLLADADAVKAKPGMSMLVLPSPPADLGIMLQKDIEGVAKDAEVQVQKHIAARKMGAAGEQWLVEGQQYTAGGACPFCGASLQGNALIQAYQDYFSDSYRRFKAEIATLEERFEAALSDAKIWEVQEILRQNGRLTEFWQAYVPAKMPMLAFEANAVPLLAGLRQVLRAYVKRKVQTPLEKIACDEEFEDAKRKWASLRCQVEAYNAAVEALNAEIAAKKKASTEGDLATARKELARLQGQKTRHADAVAKDCEHYEDLLKQKDNVEKQKKQAKADLEAYNKKVLGKYEKSINDLLELFNAGFRITGTQLQHVGGTPSSSFKIAVNDVPVELGSDKTPAGTPCFRSTMSSGDRSTLALAFFLVQLWDRPDLAKTTVVLDDPFNSMDVFRQHETRNQIHQVAKVAEQVIVLSHSKGFLKVVAEDFDAANVRAFCIGRQGTSDSCVLLWDIDSDSLEPVDKDIITLTSYYRGNEDDRRAVIRCIRPVLENHIRTRFPTEFPKEKKQWLGNMLDAIREAGAGTPLAEMKEHYDLLSGLNDYTKRHYHDEDTQFADAGAIVDAELQGTVKRVLEFLGRL